MSSLFKSITFYNDDYRNNKIPEYITFNIKENFKRTLKEFCNIVGLNEDYMDHKLSKIARRPGEEYLLTRKSPFSIWVNKEVHSDSIILKLNKNLLLHSFINYTVDDKLFTININDYRLINNMTGDIQVVNSRRIGNITINNINDNIYNLGKYDNIKGLYLLTPQNNASATVSIRIVFPL